MFHGKTRRNGCVQPLCNNLQNNVRRNQGLARSSGRVQLAQIEQFHGPIIGTGRIHGVESMDLLGCSWVGRKDAFETMGIVDRNLGMFSFWSVILEREDGLDWVLLPS